MDVTGTVVRLRARYPGGVRRVHEVPQEEAAAFAEALREGGVQITWLSPILPPPPAPQPEAPRRERKKMDRERRRQFRELGVVV